jgi:hypothetical protein
MGVGDQSQMLIKKKESLNDISHLMQQEEAAKIKATLANDDLQAISGITKLNFNCWNKKIS